MKLAHVARLVGHPQPRHFATLFRQQTGLTPTAYRKRFRTST